MLSTTAIILALLWALGLATSYTLGGFIHVLPVVAILILVRIIRRPGQVNVRRKPRYYKR